MNTRAVLVSVAVAALSDQASAYQAQLCVEVDVVYTDAGYALTNGVREDNWQTQSYARAPRGASFTLYRGATFVASGYLGDGYDPAVPAGCTPPFDALAADHTMTIFSGGVVQSNSIAAQNHNRVSRYFTFAVGVPPAGQSTVEVTLVGANDPDTEQLEDVFEAYVAGAYALYRHAGGETDNWYWFYRCWCTYSLYYRECRVAGNPYPPSDCSCTTNDDLSCNVGGNATNGEVTNGDGTWSVSAMTPNGSGMKFKLVHELGHQIARNVTNGVANGGDCSDSDAFPCDSSTHAMWSREYSKCAFKEGFAHFYAADVWNSHSQLDCAFKYYKWNDGTQPSWRGAVQGPMLDCAADDGPDPGTARDDFSNGQDYSVGNEMEASWIDQCAGWPFAGRGTEVDWMRVFWGVHTDLPSPPSFTTIARWIRDCGTVGNTTAYQELDVCADARNDSLDTNWNVNVPAAGHNIDQ